MADLIAGLAYLARYETWIERHRTDNIEEHA